MIFSWLLDKAGSGSESLKLNGSESATLLLEQLTNILIMNLILGRGGQTAVRHALLPQILCGQNLPHRHEGRIPVL